MSSKKQLLAQYDFNNVMFNNSIDGITEDEANKRVHQTMNPIIWIAGHTMWAQSNLAKLARVATNIPWVENFARGTMVPKPGDNSPTLAEIKAKWNEIYPQIGIRGGDSRMGYIADAEEILNIIASWILSKGTMWELFSILRNINITKGYGKPAIG